jgi:hypothetical protein
VAAAGADGTPSELKRRIVAGGLGLALSSAAALEALRVQRTPTALRGRELPAGRGFLVRAGRLAQLQVAIPYEPTDEEGRADALDSWVRTVRERAGDRRAAWFAPAPTSSPAGVAAHGAPPATGRMLTLIQRGMRWEFAQPHGGANGAEPLAAHFARLDLAQWGDAEALAGLLRELWLRLLAGRGMDVVMAREAITGIDNESLIIALEGDLPQ